VKKKLPDGVPIPGKFKLAEAAKENAAAAPAEAEAPAAETKEGA
jgi:hypothetical protein